MNHYFHVLRKYAVFSGRATRKEFWQFHLVNLIVAVILFALEQWQSWFPEIDSALLLFALEQWQGWFPEMDSALPIAYALVVLLPTLAVGARRLHDTGRTGWWQLINCVPLVGTIVLIIFFAQDSDPDTNRYASSAKSAIGPDDSFYADAWDELEEGNQDKALWAKLYATHSGDEKKTKAAYLKQRVSQHSDQRRVEAADAKELQKWIDKQKRRKTYDRRDLESLKEELDNDSIFLELWNKATQDANQKGETPELLYRKYRLRELKKARVAKKLGPTTLIFIVIALVGVGLVGPLGTGVTWVGAVVAVIYGLRWLFK